MSDQPPLTEADAATEAAKQAVEETEKSVDSWLEQRRRQAAMNDRAEDAERDQYFRERDEAIRQRNERVRKKLEAAGVSLETIKRLLLDLPEAAE
jgi:uncharacterized protein YggL (DUF469 family)